MDGHLRATCRTARSTRSILDPSYPNTLYAGTDVGAVRDATTAAPTGTALGTGFPLVAIWQLDLDPSHRLLAAGTHGRGAFRLSDTAATVPGARRSRRSTPASRSARRATSTTRSRVKNIGNAAATGVTITDPVPDNTSFVSADNGGTSDGGKGEDVTWTRTGLSVPAGGSIDGALHRQHRRRAEEEGRLDRERRRRRRRPPAASARPARRSSRRSRRRSRSPSRPRRRRTAVASARAFRTTLTIANNGFNADSYTLSATNAWPDDVLRRDLHDAADDDAERRRPATRSTSARRSPFLPAPRTTTLNTDTVTATSVGELAVSATATLKTIAIVGGRHAARRQRRQRAGRPGVSTRPR